MSDHYERLYLNIVKAFDRDETAAQFLRSDGEGGFAAGIRRMAREIDRLRASCGEPPHRPEGWEEAEDEEIDCELDALVRDEGVAGSNPATPTAT